MTTFFSGSTVGPTGKLQWRTHLPLRRGHTTQNSAHRQAATQSHLVRDFLNYTSCFLVEFFYSSLWSSPGSLTTSRSARAMTWRSRRQRTWRASRSAQPNAGTAANSGYSIEEGYMEGNPTTSFLSLFATFVNVSAVEYCRLLAKTPTFFILTQSQGYKIRVWSEQGNYCMRENSSRNGTWVVLYT